MPSATFVLSSVSASAPVPVTRDLTSTRYLPPAILCNVSAGGSLTYSVEVTGDALQAPGYVPANGNWFPFTNMSGLTASAVGTLGAQVTGIRFRITAYTSGSLTAQFVSHRE